MINKSAGSIIKSIATLDCPICLEYYDGEIRFPMMLCSFQHNACQSCLEKIIFKTKDTGECPFCKETIMKSKIKKFRLLHEMCETSNKLRFLGGQNMKKVSKEECLLQKQLNEQRCKSDWLIQQIACRKQLQAIRQAEYAKNISILQQSMSVLKSLLNKEQIVLYEDYQQKHHIQSKISLPLHIQHFHLIKELGQGEFGKVRIMLEKRIGFLCVVKCFQKWKVKNLGLINSVIKQIKVFCFMNSVHLNKGYGFFSDSSNVYLITEVCTDGNLKSLMKKWKNKGMEQGKISLLIHQIALGVKDLMALNIIHKQINTQSILLTYGDIVKISGLSWMSFKYEEGHQENHQSYYYDIRSLAYLTYQLLRPQVNIKKLKTPQLLHQTDKALQKEDSAHKSAYSFIKQALSRDGSPTVQINKLIQHPFIAAHNAFIIEDYQHIL